MEISADSFKTITHSYGEPPICEDKRVREFVNKLSVRDVTDIVVGAGEFGTGKFALPGSVGNTTSRFWDKGLANVALCDGPAGLRIQKLSTVTQRENSSPLNFMDMLMPAGQSANRLGNPDKEFPAYHLQQPSRLRSGQSWNEKLCTRWEKLFRERRKRLHLLRPRRYSTAYSLRRNFEYFRGPFLCGALAAAMVKGVQQEEGYYVTVKHLACNNQEDNRNKVSSNLSERALREIYLPAFEMCVRSGKAKGIMTSYNKVNGVYSPASYDLCTKLLRNEWGFDGVVMTDWFSSIVERGTSALAMRAGNDLIMPGEPISKLAIIGAVKSGKISEGDLRRCCCNVVSAIFASAIQKEYIKA